MLRGLTTVTYPTTDVRAAVAWYSELLGVDPYFAQPSIEDPAYAEFRIGDHLHELGILDSRFTPGGQAERPAGSITYWAVDDVQAAYDRLLELGATAHDAPTERGPGYVTASVIDPFGNVLGVMYNEHYLEMVG